MKPSPRGRRRERSTTDTRRRATERARDRVKVSRARVYRPSPRSSRHGAVGARDDASITRLSRASASSSSHLFQRSVDVVV